ncbi:MAG: hypothetical protein ACYSUD_08470, partial [Planctomycetota bacterium]
PQESQTIAKRLASTNKKVTEVCQKVLCGIHAAKIIQSEVRNGWSEVHSGLIVAQRKEITPCHNRSYLLVSIAGAPYGELEILYMS